MEIIALKIFLSLDFPGCAVLCGTDSLRWVKRVYAWAATISVVSQAGLQHNTPIVLYVLPYSS